MGAATANAFSFSHDVYPLEVSEFQSHHLAHHSFTPALRRHHSYPVLHRAELRMDAGSFVSRLFALRLPAPVGLETLAARDREEVGEGGGYGGAIGLEG